MACLISGILDRKLIWYNYTILKWFFVYLQLYTLDILALYCIFFCHHSTILTKWYEASVTVMQYFHVIIKMFICKDRRSVTACWWLVSQESEWGAGAKHEFLSIIIQLSGAIKQGKKWLYNQGSGAIIKFMDIRIRLMVQNMDSLVHCHMYCQL